MRLKLLPLALLLCAAPPALAQQADKSHAATDGGESMKTDEGLAETREQMSAYGQWITQLNDATMEANAALGAIQGEWAAAMQLGSIKQTVARFRPTINAARVKVDRARDRLRVIDTPTFPALELDAALQTPALLKETLGLLDRIDKVLDGFDTILDAMASGNDAAIVAAARELANAATALLQGQALMAEAGLVTTEKGSFSYELQFVQARVFRSAARAMEGFVRLSFKRADASLAKDLKAEAETLHAAITRARAAFTAEKAKWQDALADIDAAADSAALLRKTIAVLDVDVQIFDAADRYAAALDRTSAQAARRPLNAEDIKAVLIAYRAMIETIDRVARAEAEAMAED